MRLTEKWVEKIPSAKADYAGFVEDAWRIYALILLNIWMIYACFWHGFCMICVVYCRIEARGP